MRGQYTAGTIDGEPVVGYRQEEDVAPDSQTETYLALRLRVENWRWAGVPIYVRTGKRLPARVTEVALTFRQVPFLLFDHRASRDLRPNTLILRIQPDEGISLEFGAKVPGEKFHLRSVAMDFSYAEAFAGADAADGYERLIHDAMVGDATLFIRSDEVRAGLADRRPLPRGVVRARCQPALLRGRDLGPAHGRPAGGAVGGRVAQSGRRPGAERWPPDPPRAVTARRAGCPVTA